MNFFTGLFFLSLSDDWWSQESWHELQLQIGSKIMIDETEEEEASSVEVETYITIVNMNKGIKNY